MREIKFYVGLVALIAGFYGCQKPINLTATSTNANILVVEGLINVTDSTKIKLSRTVIIGNKNTANPEGGATISIENAQATVATLTEITKGTYATPVLNLDNTQKYRLRIKLANGKTYLSDLTETKVTPPIDSIGYNVINDGIQIYANAHDDTNNSRYYLYNFTDTWKFKAQYRSLLIWDKVRTGLRERKEAEEIWECFGNGASNNIVLNSTAALTQDVAYQAPIVFIGGGSEKISIRYTISVTQTALTKEAYVFWENLKKSTESLGSIFDAQPSQLVGNIHNVADADEPVIGYISAGTTHTKRIFIDKKELPSGFKTEYPFACAPLSSGPEWMFSHIRYVPLYTEPNTGDIKYTDRECGDCTLRGTLKQPVFWK